MVLKKIFKGKDGYIRLLSINEINNFIQQDISSTKKQLSKTGQKYYEGEHDILNYRMFYFNSDGNLVEDKSRSNVKIPHPFFTELVDQCSQYMLSGGDFIRTDIPELQEELQKYFNDDFNAELSEVITGAKSKGFDYMYAYTKADGQIGFQHADGMGVVECRAKETDDGCDYVIYYYTDRITKDNRTITRIQVWDADQTYFYVRDENGNITEDKDEKLNPRPHVLYKKPNDNSTYYDGFGFIPFFRLDNNKKQISDLRPIKALLDDYDMMSCGLSNNLSDFDVPLWIVKGFEGDNLDELQQNIKTKKIVGVNDSGDVEARTIDVPYQARLTKMQEDEKNIYRFGMGFNSAQLGDGNVTNVVIKSRYALLDLKCNKLEIKLKQFLHKILKVILKQINENNGTDYSDTDVWFEFDREVMTNALDNAQIELVDAQKEQTEINTLLSLNNVLDNETIIKKICECLDLDYEDIKDVLPDSAEDDLRDVSNTLEQIPIEE